MVNSKMYNARYAKLGSVLVLASLLGGCAIDDAALGGDYQQPYGGSDRHPLTVVKAPITMEVSSVRGTLQPPQIDAVNSFVHQALQAGVTPITVSQPSGGGASARVASEIASLMVQQGVPRSYVRFANYKGGASSPIRLSYVSAYGQSLKCGKWPDDATDTEENMLTANHGCAVQANIAAMVANPETLTVPAARTPIPSEPRVAAITAYAKGAAVAGSTSSSATTAATTP
jgi:pilus assembly protein CpaD